MCRECIRLPENREKVHLGVIRNDFIFSVESTGCVSAKTLVPRVGRRAGGVRNRHWKC